MERQYGLTLEDLTLWCAGLSQPQVRRQLKRWSLVWPPHRPRNPRSAAFSQALQQAERVIRAYTR